MLVLEQRDTPGGKAAGIECEGFRLDPGPSIVILIRIYEELFRRAGRRMSDTLRFIRLDPFTRVYAEGEEVLDLPADREQCLRLLGDRSPADSLALRSLMDKLDRVAPLIDRSIFARPYHHAWQLFDPHLVRTALQFDVSKSYRQIVDDLFTWPLLRAFFYGFPSYGGQTYDAKAAGALLIPYLMLAEGVWYPEGGVAAIPRAFEQLARDLGVQFRYGAAVEGLRVVSGEVRGVRIAGGTHERADAVIANVDRFRVAEWLGRTIDLAPSFSYFTLHWGLRRDPGGLSHHTLLVPRSFERGFEQLYRDRRFPDEPIVYLNATHLVDPCTAPPGQANLFAVVTSPAIEQGFSWDEAETQGRIAVRRELARHGLDFSDKEIVFERVQTPRTFESRDGNYRGSLYGVDEKHRIWGLFPPRVIDEEIRNLFYCGGSVQPGAGMPMVTLSGKFAAELLDRQVR